MTIIPIALTPGMMKNGTPYSGKNFWVEGNYVRWYNDSLRSIGGWIARSDPETGDPLAPLTVTPETEVFRDALTWVDNANSRFYVFGSNSTVQLLKGIGDAVDITPAGFVGSDSEPTTQAGFGARTFGSYTFGSPRPFDPDAIRSVYRWDFDAWGEDLLAAAADNAFRGGLYSLDPNAAAPNDVLEVVPNAPTDINGMTVTEERIVMTIGDATEARKVRWSDRENREVWAPDVANYAGEVTLQGVGRLLSINKVLNQVLIVSESDATIARFVGAPFVYGFDKVADNCGALSKGAVYVAGRVAIWLGRATVWMYDGSVSQVACSVMDELRVDVDPVMLAKMHNVGIPEFSEVWWFYQSKDATEVNSYVVYNYASGLWYMGKLSRTCGVSGSAFVFPVMVDTDAVVINHEQRDIFVEESYAITGPLELGDGEDNLSIDKVFLDCQKYGDIEMTLLGKQFPTDEEECEFGPYDFANPMNVRAMARQLRMRVDGLQVAWEVGYKMRFDVNRGTGMR